MKVKELIDLLKEFNSEMEITIGMWNMDTAEEMHTEIKAIKLDIQNNRIIIADEV